MSTRRKGFPARALTDDPADVVRRVEARTVFLDLLTRDCRVRAAWLRWTQTEAAQVLVARVSVGGSLTIRADRDDGVGLARAGRTLLAAIPGAPTPPWLPTWLGGFALRMVLSCLNGVIEPWTFTLARPWESRQRRATKTVRSSGTSTIRRDVEWYYRAALKSPKDSVSRLSREYAHADPAYHQKDARSVVRDGIARAKQALDIE